ncbi:MAG TPA: hypothetical protein VEX15_21810 [Nocardioidaceae bacterium]|nr:hypothetical protein [Nocardioidaceae bacterium]
MSTDSTGDRAEAALILDGLADALELLPIPARRDDVIHKCRQLARDLYPDAAVFGQTFEVSKAYGGDEWRNALLRSMVGGDKADALLSRG